MYWLEASLLYLSCHKPNLPCFSCRVSLIHGQSVGWQSLEGGGRGRKEDPVAAMEALGGVEHVGSFGEDTRCGGRI